MTGYVRWKEGGKWLKKSKYRIKKFDVVNNIWILQEKKLFVFWIAIGVGSKEKLQETIER